MNPTSLPLDTGHEHLAITGVSKHFPGTRALDDISLGVLRGTTTAIVGPSGSGKTTLLRIIAGFEVPDEGSVRLNDRVVAEGAHMVPPHQRNIGLVAQDGALFPHLDVAANIAFGLNRARFRGTRAKDRVVELLEMVSLTAEHARRRPDQLSGGQQQRVALARALAREPELMLLDEPFSALDAGLRVATRKAVAQTLAAAGVTTILVTHDQSEALSFADQVAILRDGKLAQVGAPFVVYTRPSDLETARFLGDAVILDADVRGSLASCALGHIPVRLPPGQGAMKLLLRPEQIRIAGSGEIHGTIIETDYFGPEVTVTIRLDDRPDHTGTAQTISIRHWNAGVARPGAQVYLRVVGEGVAFPPPAVGAA